MQNKKQSFREAVINTLVGFCITLFAAPLINWICGIKANYSQVSLSVILFTIISIIRGYVIRRYFNKKDATLVELKEFNEVQPIEKEDKKIWY